MRDSSQNTSSFYREFEKRAVRLNLWWSSLSEWDVFQMNGTPLFVYLLIAVKDRVSPPQHRRVHTSSRRLGTIVFPLDFRSEESLRCQSPVVNFAGAAELERLMSWGLDSGTL